MESNLNLKTKSYEGVHEGVECDIQTSKRRSEDQSVEDNSKAYKRENYDDLEEKKKELEKENRTLSSQIKKKAESCMRLQRENEKLLKEVKEKCSKDEMSKLEAMNPDESSQSDDKEQDQNSSESWGKFNSSPDCSADIDEEGGESDSTTVPMQMEKLE